MDQQHNAGVIPPGLRLNLEIRQIDAIAKALIADVDATVAKAFSDARDHPGAYHVRVHEPVNATQLKSHFACTNCGTEFTAEESDETLAQKRQRQVGVTDDPDAVQKGLRELNRRSGHDRLH